MCRSRLRRRERVEQLLTVEEVAMRLQVNEQTIRRWLRGGELSGVPFGGRTGWRINEADLLAFLERRREDAEQGKAAA
jgi:excisionase family DNA binding protein